MNYFLQDTFFYDRELQASTSKKGGKKSGKGDKRNLSTDEDVFFYDRELHASTSKKGGKKSGKGDKRNLSTHSAS